MCLTMMLLLASAKAGTPVKWVAPCVAIDG
jgi:hypothetical protein